MDGVFLLPSHASSVEEEREERETFIRSTGVRGRGRRTKLFSTREGRSVKRERRGERRSILSQIEAGFNPPKEEREVADFPPCSSRKKKERGGSTGLDVGREVLRSQHVPQGGKRRRRRCLPSLYSLGSEKGGKKGDVFLLLISPALYHLNRYNVGAKEEGKKQYLSVQSC